MSKQESGKDYKPESFIGEPIDVIFESDYGLDKTPKCPLRFLWRGIEYSIEHSISEWKDFSRKGRFAKNMRPAHAQRAKVRGSLGVGRFYFRVMTAGGRIFDIYFDRSSTAKNREETGWFLFQEIKLEGNQ